MLRFTLHYGIHFIVPFFIAFVFYKENRLQVLLILLAGILIDIDHLIADPIFDPNRCSVGFHLLHQYWAVAVYISLLFFKKTRLFGFSLVLHIIADTVDCWLM
ncbi:MAG: DUF6122 family protein [Cellulophaga sp.]|nr:DUF6122 family protein [Cellulophaga sp.]